MTTKDRILCAFGFHGPLEDTEDELFYYWHPGEVTEKRISQGRLQRCSICKRHKKITV